MIQVKGTTMGVMTDSNGKYTLAVPTGSNTCLHLCGDEEVEVEISGRNTVDVVMESDTQVMDEIVVTAWVSGLRRRLLANSTSEVKSDELTATRTNSFATALSVRLPG
jgi:hypothetical protein